MQLAYLRYYHNLHNNTQRPKKARKEKMHLISRIQTFHYITIIFHRILSLLAIYIYTPRGVVKKSLQKQSLFIIHK